MSTPWIDEARKLEGLKEVPGPASNPEIVRMWKDIKRGGIKDDATPWCAAFVGAMLERAGIVSSRFESALSYAKWGKKLDYPLFGCIGVMEREGGGHVTFIIGHDGKGNLLGLGGNQADAVNVRSFPKERFTAFRWPSGVPLGSPLELMASAKTSTKEA